MGAPGERGLSQAEDLPVYVLLTGCKKNAGDFLIAHAARELLSKYAPCKEFKELPSWLPVTSHLDIIRSSKALLLCGGPAFQSGLGTTIYPITQDLERITVPIISFGLGWKAFPGDEFDRKTVQPPASAQLLLDRIRNDYRYAGCRDYLTLSVLKRWGIRNAVMTGCPAWYDPQWFDQPPRIPEKIRNVAVTPAELPRFNHQSKELLQLVRDLFPEARRTCSFHRGWVRDEHTTGAHAENALDLRAYAEKAGFDCQDISGSVEGMLRYEDYDLHIGYRVHAHLKFLSARKPSFLIAEDGRGRGALEATSSCGVCGWQTSLPAACCETLCTSGKMLRFVRRRFGAYRVPQEAIPCLGEMIEQEITQGFPRHQGSLAVIDATRTKMLEMIRAMPS